MSVMIDDVGCSRRHQCPQCVRPHSYPTFISFVYKISHKQLNGIFLLLSLPWAMTIARFSGLAIKL